MPDPVSISPSSPRTPTSTLASSLRRHARVYAAMWKNSVVREMSFKVNFLLWIVVEFLWFALQLVFVGVIYQHTDHIGDWSKWQVVLLMGAAHFIQQIFQGIFLSNMIQLSELVRTGKLDFILLLPANTRFMISLRHVDLGGFVNAASALGVIVYALVQLHRVPSPLEIFGFMVFAITGVFVHYALMFLLATVSFYTVRAQGIIWGYYSLFNLARMPDAAFRGLFKVVFTFAVPILLIANVPAKVLIAKLQSPAELLLLLFMCAAALALSEWVWRFSVRRYSSASS